jgi:hypothetical protein
VGELTDVRKALLAYLACLQGLWVVGLFAVGIQVGVFNREYPYDTLLFMPGARFTDFTVFYPRLAVFGNAAAFFSPDGYPFTLPAPLLLCQVALWKLTQHPLALYLGIVGLFAGIVGLAAFRLFPNRGIASVLAFAVGTLSFPLLYLLDRGNLEGFVWMAASIGIFCFAKRRYYVAAAFLALATSMKIFPCVLLLLFLAKRRYKEFFAAAAMAVAFTLGSLWVTGPSIVEAGRGILMGLDYNRRMNVLQFRWTEIGFDHCLFTYVKWIAVFCSSNLSSFKTLLPKLLVLYAVVAVAGFLALYAIKLRKMPVLNQVMVLSALSVTLPYSSFEYTLVQMVAPFFLLLLFLVNDVASGQVALRKSDMVALLIPFAVLFAPTSFMILYRVGFGGQIKTAVLLFLVGVCLRAPLPSSVFGENRIGPSLENFGDHDVPDALRSFE